MRMNNGLRRLISMMMCLILVVGMLPSSALATEASPAEVPAAVTEPAATEAPAAPAATEAPAAEVPAAQEPAAEEPAAEEPAADEPAAEEPAAEEPAAEEPAAEEPAAEEPAAEEPADDEEEVEDVPTVPAAAVVSGTILWVNREAQAEEARPASVTLTLSANGAAVSTIEVPNPGSETEWPYSFGEQPAQDAGGNAIAYTVAEAAPADYTVTYDGLTVTNIYAPAPAEEPDPVQELFDILMAFETYEELGGYMDAMTEEQYELLAQFSEEQNAALTEKVAALQENSAEVLPGPGPDDNFDEDQEYTVDHIDIACDNLTANVLGETVTFSFTPADVRNGEVEVFINGTQYTNTSGSSTDTAGRNQVRIDGSFNIGSYNDPNSFTVQIRKLIETENYGEVYVTLSVTISSYWSTSNVCPGYQKKPGNQSGIDVVLSTSSVTYTQLNIVKSVEGLTFPEDKTFTFDIKNSQGTTVKTVTVDVSAGTSVGTAIVTGLAAGTYTVVERTGAAAVEGYKLTVSYTNDGQAVVALKAPVTVTVTNAYEVDTVDISGAKAWDDANNQDGKRPASITVNLLANGEAVDSRTVTADDNWAWTFTDMPKYDEDGNAITYTITEDAVAGYTAAVDGYNVTNTHVPETVTVSGSKTWNDNNNQDGIRPAAITIRLYADGVEVAQKTVTEADGWAWSFADLPKYENGVEITYTITEDAVEGYTASVSGANVTNTHEVEKTEVSGAKTWNDAGNQDGKRPASITIRLYADGVEVASKTVTKADNWAWTFTDLPVYAAGEKITYTITEDTVAAYETAITGYNVTNTHAPEKTNISGSKTWVDNNDQDGKRPDSITINLLADGVVIASKRVTAADNWEWSFINLDVYKNGVKIVYTITEDAVEGYETVVDGSNVTNTHEVEKTSVSGSKTWDDADNQDGIRPASITIRLYADGEEVASKTVTEADGWAWSFEDLDKYADGVEITYTITEDAVAEYESTVDGYNITNTHTPEVTEVSGAKTWADNNDQDGKRPAYITINLLANGKVIKTVTVTAEDGWAWSFADLPKYEDGTEIAYSITEDAVEGYTASVSGYNVTNTHEIEKTEVPVTKVWNDNDDQDGIRPNDITVVLLANGRETGRSLVLSQGNDWADIFTDLDKYAGGEEIVYTVEEIIVDGYTTAITGSQTAGYTITNSHTPEVTEVEGTKTWVDDDNQDGVRPASITINLLANGKVIKTVTVTAEDGWAWSFENLPKYENHGTEIVYSITENTVENYSTEYDGYNVINSYTPAKTSVTVTKSWQDSNDQDGIRPISITVKLLADGVDTGETLVLSADNSWTHSFTELDKYRPEGIEIVYTIEEVAVKGYDTVITGDQTTGYTITNSHTPEVIEIAGSKTWDDADNQDGKRPESITIRLHADGVEVAFKTVTAADGWAWSFENLPKYSQGVEIVYTITEDAVDGYTTTYDGYNVTNEYTPEEISITVVKAWADKKNAEGKRPDEVTIMLYANGVDTGLRLILTEDNNWVGSFTDLPKYADGQLIEYTIDEVKVSGYNTVIRGSVDTGFTVTNSLKDIPTTGDERMPMLWIGLMMASMVSFIWAVVPMGKKKRR